MSDKEKALRLKDYLKDQKMFMVVDESNINGKQYLNISVGKFAAPGKTLVFNCKTFSRPMNSDIKTREIDDAFYSFGVAQKVLLIVSKRSEIYDCCWRPVKKSYRTIPSSSMSNAWLIFYMIVQ